MDRDRQVIQSKTTAKEWMIECARVKNKLVLRNTFDQKEWRQHIEKAKTFSGNIEEIV